MGVELQMPVEGLRREVKQTGWNALQVELCSRVLAANPKVTQMYADLQSVASMPQGHVNNQPSFDTDMAVLSKFVALHRSNLKIQRYVEELKAAKEAQEQAYRQQLEQSISTANHQLRAVQVDLDTLRGEEVNLKQHLTEIRQDYDQVQKHSKNLEKENQQLLTLVEHRQNQIENLRKKEKEHESNIGSLNEEIQKINNQKKEEANSLNVVQASYKYVNFVGIVINHATITQAHNTDFLSRQTRPSTANNA
jgi:chromosome segregation ATPase